MSSLLVLRALLFAGECFLASLLLPLLGFAAAALLRRRAALRHLVWATLFGVLAVLPAAALLLPARLIVEHVAAPVVDAAPVVAAPLPAAPVVTLPVAAVAPPAFAAVFTPENIAALLVALWLAGLAWQGLRLGVGGLGLMRLRRRSMPFASDIESGCAVRVSADETGPSTFGVLHPVILLPRSAPGWPAVRLEAVLRHEAAHVARRDAASQLLARLACALYWPNPLLWLGYRALRRDAEIAADDAVLASGMTPSLYAAELLGLAGRGAAPGIAMAASPLAARVQAVLAQNSSRKGVSRMDMARTVSFGLAATLLLGAARFDLAVAQDASPRVPVAPKVTVEVPVAAAAQPKAIAAEADRIKANADMIARRARAKADAQTDPAKKAQYKEEAAQVAAQSARVKAQADRIGDLSLSGAERAAAARALSEEALANAQAALAERLKNARPEQQQGLQMAERAVAQARLRMAEAGQEPQAGAQAHASASQDAETSINDVTTVTHSRRADPGADDNAAARAQADAMKVQTDQMRLEMAEIQPRIQRALANAHLDEQVTKALADAHISEAIANAHIGERIAQAMAKVQAMNRDMPPVPPVPAIPSTLPPPPPN